MANIRTGRKSGFIMRGGGMKRETRWLDLPPSSTGLAAASAEALILQLTTAERALLPFTVVRTRGMFFVSSDQQAASEFYQVALGAAVVSFQAATIGVTAVPVPDDD